MFKYSGMRLQFCKRAFASSVSSHVCARENDEWLKGWMRTRKGSYTHVYVERVIQEQGR
jgi:hypothetical protein